MGEPACFLSSVCLECGRFLDGEANPPVCPHCGGRRIEARPAISVRSANFILYCDRWADTVAFWGERLGLAETFRNEWFVEFEVSDTARVSVADASRSSVGDVGGRGVTISMRVSNLDDTRSALRQNDVDVGPVRLRFGCPSFDVRDPEGNRIEFWQGD